MDIEENSTLTRLAYLLIDTVSKWNYHRRRHHDGAQDPMCPTCSIGYNTAKDLVEDIGKVIDNTKASAEADL